MSISPHFSFKKTWLSALEEKSLNQWQNALNKITPLVAPETVYECFEKVCKEHWYEGIKSLLHTPAFWHHAEGVLKDYLCMHALCQAHLKTPSAQLIPDFLHQWSIHAPVGGFYSLHDLVIASITSTGQESALVQDILLNKHLISRSDILRFTPCVYDWLSPAHIKSTPSAQACATWWKQTIHPMEFTEIMFSLVHEHALSRSPEDQQKLDGNIQMWWECFAPDHPKSWWAQVEQRWDTLVSCHASCRQHGQMLGVLLEKQFMELEVLNQASKTPSPISHRKL